MRACLLMVAVVFGISGCSARVENGVTSVDDSDDTPTSNHRVLLLVQPEDLATDMATTPVRVILQPRGAFVTSALTSEVMNAITVTSDGIAVEFEATIVQDNSLDSSSDSKNPEYPTYFELRPKDGKWPDGWSEVRVGNRLGTVEPVGFVEDGDSLISRFSPMSRPTLQMFEVCIKNEARTSVIWRFSEPVDAQSASGALGIRQSNVRCALVVDSSLSSRRPTLGCSGLDLERPFEIGLSPGLLSAEGRPVTLFSGESSFSMQLTFDSLGRTQEGCRGYHF